MGIFRAEYTTLSQLRASGEGAQLDIEGNAADPFLLSLIREASADIDGAAGRKFAPYVTTQTYDTPWGGVWDQNTESLVRRVVNNRSLPIDTDDLLAVTTLTNGDGTVITAAQYLLYPANVYPKNEIRLKVSSGLAWQPDSAGDREQVISVVGVFGYHEDYPNSAWLGAGTLAGHIGSTTATTFAFSTGAGLEPGMLLQVESEYLYVGQVAGTTATVERANNGSTAAAHTTGAAISYWQPVYAVGRIARMAATALWNLRANPEGKQVSVNGVTFTTPNSIQKWIGQEIDQAGLTKTVTG